MEHQLFISYKHGKRSTEYAKELCDYLTAPADALGYEIFMDDKDLRGGDAWTKEVDEALQKCTHFLALLNTAYWLSKQCQRELFASLDRFEKTGTPRLLFVKAEEIRADLLTFDEGRRTFSLTSPDPQVRRVGDLHFLGPYDENTRLVRLASDAIERTDQYAQLLNRLEDTLQAKPRARG
jgi:hypothetical protein